MKSPRPWKDLRVSLNKVIFIGFLCLSLGGAIGFYWPKLQTQLFPYLGFKKPATLDWSPLDSLYTELLHSYDGDIDKGKLILGAKKGLVESLGDPYTNFMSAEESNEFQKSLHGDVGAGIGVEMRQIDNVVRVVRVLPDNPAKKAGILAGDIFYKVNGEDILGLDSNKVSAKIRGTAGTEVEITILRDNSEHTFKMTREKINNVSAYVDYFDQTALITVTRFDNDTGQIVKQITQDFPAKNINKVILDLRNNGGGYVSSAVELASLWLDNQKILIQKSKHNADITTNSYRNQASLSHLKTIVLVNGSTASAAEIVTGALKDYHKATIVGEKTFGKGVVQVIQNLPRGETLKVTTARWFTPLDHSINKTGIQPDHEVTRSFKDINENKDPQLDFAKTL